MATMTVQAVAALLNLADAAGQAAALACTPRPMVVQGYGAVEGGACGFAWVSMPGNTALGRAIMKEARREAKQRFDSLGDPSYMGWSKGYPKGLSMWVSGYGQSMARKEAYARAYAEVLRNAGHERVYAGSRMD